MPAAIESGFLPQDVQIFQSWDGGKTTLCSYRVDTLRYRVFRYDRVGLPFSGALRRSYDTTEFFFLRWGQKEEEVGGQRWLFCRNG